jgi:hypothetical protein
VQPRPAAAARPPAPKPKRPPWTWLERFLIIQAFIPVFLFVPGFSAGRIVIRMAVFLMGPAVWFAIVQSGRFKAGSSWDAVGLCLKLVAGWVFLAIFHWETRSLPAAAVQATFYVAVFSPVFWATKALGTPNQIGRLMAILLIANGISALVGLGQVFRPDTFNPPVIQGITGMAEDSLTVLALTYTDQNGRKILRPCGLTDSPGGASAAAPAAVLIGLACALRPIGTFKRLACLALAFCGMAVTYYSQVRMIFVMEILCMGVLAGVFVLQKNFGYASVLGGLGAAMIVGALTWVMVTSGRVVVERFLGLAERSFAESYDKSARAGMVTNTLTVFMWDNPLGCGIGRWGPIAGAFGDPTDPGVWVEVMIPAWVVDGGIPLLLLYNIAIALAMLDTLRIALRSRDGDVRFWAAVVFALNLSVIATCFSYVTFLTVIGMQFWFLAAVVHAADYLARREATAKARRRPARPASPLPPRPPGPMPSPYPTAPA